MMTTNTPSVSIQIYGGNNQILPNATYAVQNFYGDELASQNTAGESSSPAPLSPPEQRLSIYINNVDTLRGYLTQLQACKTAKEVGEVVATVSSRDHDSRRAHSEAKLHHPPPTIPHECGDRQEYRQPASIHQSSLGSSQTSQPPSRSLKTPKKGIT